MLRTLSLACIPLALVAACADPDGAEHPPPDQDIFVSDDANVYAWEPLGVSTGDVVLQDEQTGSTFNLRGEAVLGPLSDERRMLRPVPGVNMFWFAWSIYYPGSQVWGHTEGVRDAVLPSDKTGSIACSGGKDCIPSLPHTGPPRSDLGWARHGEEGLGYLRDSDLVLGVFHHGAARAYPHNLLWRHEIANDRIGDDSFSITFCPLTGSGVGFAAGAEGRTFGVSGNLHNSNLVMWDHGSDSLWPQLWMGGVSGAGAGQWLEQFPLVEMTYGAWRALHPDTLVLSENTGFGIDYTRYPYGDYRTNDADTFRATNPSPDPVFPNKDMVFGLVDRARGHAKAYHHGELFAAGPTGVINDTFGDEPVVIVYDQSARLVRAFYARTPDGVMSFRAATLP